jgi:hypothetical protein
MFLGKSSAVVASLAALVALASWMLASHVRPSQRDGIQSLSALGVPDSRAMPFETLQRRSALVTTTGDVTAILLNWNRLESLVLVVEHLCRYDYIFATVVVWNNNPDVVLTNQVLPFGRNPCENCKPMGVDMPCPPSTDVLFG